jgi:hypothetical protein
MTRRRARVALAGLALGASLAIIGEAQALDLRCVQGPVVRALEVRSAQDADGLPGGLIWQPAAGAAQRDLGWRSDSQLDCLACRFAGSTCQPVARIALSDASKARSRDLIGGVIEAIVRVPQPGDPACCPGGRGHAGLVLRDDARVRLPEDQPCDLGGPVPASRFAAASRMRVRARRTDRDDAFDQEGARGRSCSLRCARRRSRLACGFARGARPGPCRRPPSPLRSEHSPWNRSCQAAVPLWS